MSFFSKILKGLGFEEEEQAPKQKKEKKKKEKSKPVINASFDLEKEVLEHKPVQPAEEQPTFEQEQPTVQQQPVNNSFSLDIIKVINQIEVQNVVSKIKRGEKVIINMSALNGQDLTRSLDFLTGAVFALNKTIQKVDNSIFIIQ